MSPVLTVMATAPLYWSYSLDLLAAFLCLQKPPALGQILLS